MAYWILMLCLFKRTFLKQLPYRLKTALLTTDMARRKPEGLNNVPAAIFFCVVFCLLIVNCLKLWLLFCRCDITIATREGSRDALRQRCFLRVSKICWVVHVLLGCVVCAFIIVPLEQINLLPWISFSSPSLESVDETDDISVEHIRELTVRARGKIERCCCYMYEGESAGWLSRRDQGHPNCMGVAYSLILDSMVKTRLRFRINVERRNAQGTRNNAVETHAGKKRTKETREKH